MLYLSQSEDTARSALGNLFLTQGHYCHIVPTIRAPPPKRRVRPAGFSRHFEPEPLQSGHHLLAGEEAASSHADTRQVIGITAGVTVLLLGAIDSPADTPVRTLTPFSRSTWSHSPSSSNVLR